ncbi:hypothetical protein F5B21DRAFT_519863 [Xylaria acuta]|nr:hypothetical protein F5B21DRAFT_519863 [Xylaria acuta]
MCRRVITHRMHHDVAAAMIMDPVSPNPTVYANPLRTNFHRCELLVPPPPPPPPPHVNVNRLSNSSAVVECEYHTCCIPDERVEYCDGLIAYLGYGVGGRGEEEDFEPEECDAFVLEHHHERLPYFGNSERAYHHAPPVPATWREMVRVRGSDADLSSFPGFAAHHRREWEEKCFAECERLYTLENDTAILYASMQDQDHLRRAPHGAPYYYSWDMMRAARANVLNIEGKLHEQRRLIKKKKIREDGDLRNYSVVSPGFGVRGYSRSWRNLTEPRAGSSSLPKFTPL